MLDPTDGVRSKHRLADGQVKCEGAWKTCSKAHYLDQMSAAVRIDTSATSIGGVALLQLAAFFVRESEHPVCAASPRPSISYFFDFSFLSYIRSISGVRVVQEFTAER